MTPSAPDPETIARRLALIEEMLAALRAVGEVTAADLRSDLMKRGALERFVQVIIDLALEVNGHLVVAVGYPAPKTARESFVAMARAGVLDPELADRLAPTAGFRNVLVHHYVDIDLKLVAEAIVTVVAEYPVYVQQVARFLEGIEEQSTQ